ncbi:MAG: hypothetical protein AcusKO_35250 [Acuticoccus sp.]
MIDPALLIALLAPLLVGGALGLLALSTPSRALAGALGLCAVALLGTVPLLAEVILPPQSAPAALGIARTGTYLAALGGVCVLACVMLLVTAATQRRENEAAPAGAIATAARNGLAPIALPADGSALAAENLSHYLELATRNSQISLYLQDADLVYRWVLNPRLGILSDDLVGKSDHEVMPKDQHNLVIGHKTRAIETGQAQTFETSVTSADETLWFRVDVTPISGPDGSVSGVVCSAIDITRAKRLDMMRTDLSRRLAETLQRFNLALRSERIIVFSQDLSMRYTWANSDETQIGSVIGRTPMRR